MPAPTSAGSAHPLGSTPGPDGVNFSLFTENATGVELLLFETPDSPQPYQTIRLDPYVNKTFHFWHVFVAGCGRALTTPTAWMGPSTRTRGTASTVTRC